MSADCTPGHWRRWSGLLHPHELVIVIVNYLLGRKVPQQAFRENILDWVKVCVVPSVKTHFERPADGFWEVKAHWRHVLVSLKILSAKDWNCGGPEQSSSCIRWYRSLQIQLFEDPSLTLKRTYQCLSVPCWSHSDCHSTSPGAASHTKDSSRRLCLHEQLGHLQNWSCGKNGANQLWIYSNTHSRSSVLFNHVPQSRDPQVQTLSPILRRIPN